MVVLVTGGCGYIGSLLVRELLKNPQYEDETVRILDNMFRDRYVSLYDLPSDGRVEMVYGDIKEEEDVKVALEDVTTVFSLSDITNAPLSFEREELTFKTNYEGVLNLYELSVKSSVERMVYTSTASVYGTTNGIVDETYDCEPLSPYGESKLKAEKAIQQRTKENGFDWKALRLGTVVGWTIGMRFDTVINRFTFLASVGHPLTVWEEALNEARPYVNVKDVIRGYFFASQNDEMKGEVCNLVAENLSIDGVVDRIRKRFPDVNVEISPAPNLNQVSYQLSSDKIKNMGFNYEYTIMDGIDSIAEKLSGLKSR